MIIDDAKRLSNSASWVVVTRCDRAVYDILTSDGGERVILCIANGLDTYNKGIDGQSDRLLTTAMAAVDGFTTTYNKFENVTIMATRPLLDVHAQNEELRQELSRLTTENDRLRTENKTVQSLRAEKMALIERVNELTKTLDK